MIRGSLIVIGLVLGAGWAWAYPSHWMFGALPLIPAVMLTGRCPEKPIVCLGPHRWTARDFARGFLITGDTGAGKTSSGVMRLLRELFQNVPNFGGLCIDEKGVFSASLLELAEYFGRKDDILVLTVRPDDASPDWKPACRLNLVGDRRIPYSSYGRMVIDMAMAMGQERDQSFFREQAEMNIAAALEALDVVGLDVTLENIHTLFQREGELQGLVDHLKRVESPEAGRLSAHFEELLKQPAEQRSGTLNTVVNYVRHFAQPEIAEVFCRDSTFSISDIDRGKLICFQMPQRFMTERRYVGVFLKSLCFLHVIRRFDKPAAERANDNLLVACVDEAHRFVTSAKNGFGEHLVADVVREAGCAIILATQSVTSLVPPLGKDLAQTLTLNLRNRMGFTAADDPDAEDVARRIGKRKKKKTSWSYGKDGSRRNVSEEEEFIVSPHDIRKLRKHECILIHASNGHRRVTLPPLRPDGRRQRWYRPRWFW
ncbi:MAG: type IV secretion system DNA-binding domain-containing protein [Verrucomicrobiales bacterium]|nr:type IV secretion system DNA-binding domain-containing protein [Verrucomicrobiales bacterium]